MWPASMGESLWLGEVMLMILIRVSMPAGMPDRRAMLRGGFGEPYAGRGETRFQDRQRTAGPTRPARAGDGRGRRTAGGAGARRWLRDRAGDAAAGPAGRQHRARGDDRPGGGGGDQHRGPGVAGTGAQRAPASLAAA